MQIGYNGLERRQSERRNRHGGDCKRNRNEKLERKIDQMTALIGNKRQRGGSEEAETGMATAEDEGDEEANNSSGGDRQGGA